MRCFVVVPGALVPAPLSAAIIAQAQQQGAVGHLERLLARSTVHAYTELPYEFARAPHMAWIWKQFSDRDDQPVTAPYVAQMLANELASGLTQGFNEGLTGGITEGPVPTSLWHCDPVHIAFARDHLLLTDLGAAPLSDEETRALLPSAHAAALEQASQLTVIGGHWFLALDPPWDIEAVSLAAALDTSVQEVLPRGDDAWRWRKLLTEVQIAWHAHPVNDARAEQDVPLVNGLWLHGGGAHSALDSPFDVVWGEDLALRGWAQASGTPMLPLAQAQAVDGDVLALLPALAPAQRREAWGDWIVALSAVDAALGRIERLVQDKGGVMEVLLFGRSGFTRATVSSADRWRLWRKQSLLAVLAEPAEAIPQPETKQ
jgi:hypothetical protein